MAARGVNVPPGIPVHSLSEVPAAAKAMASANDGQVVVKSQILAGGRGLGKFTNGFQGGVHVCDAADAKLGFDDSASFRQKELFAMRDTSQEDPR